MNLSRTVPAQRKTVAFRWIREFLPMSDKYREIRFAKRRKMCACWWCRHEFTNGETMHLAAPERGANVVLCAKCAAEAKEDDDA